MDSSVGILWMDADLWESVGGKWERQESGVWSLEPDYTALQWGPRDSPPQLDACGNGAQQGAPPSPSSRGSAFVCSMVGMCASVCSDHDCF